VLRGLLQPDGPAAADGGHALGKEDR
jgi:hypothetical protein